MSADDRAHAGQETAEVPAPEMTGPALYYAKARHREDQLELRLKERLTAGQYALVQEYITVREILDAESWSKSFDHLARGLMHHLPGMAPTVRMLVEHCNDTGMDEVGTCCLE
jgi:hypothetical protein